MDEVKDIRDKAEAMAAYARQAKDLDLIRWATEIKVRAERRAGEMLRQSAELGERARGDGSINQHNRASHADTPTLADLGVSPMQSSRWQTLAAMSADHFEAAVETAKETAGEVTTAYLLREAKKEIAEKHPPKKSRRKAYRKVSEADKRRLEELDEAQTRGVSLLSTYARLTLKALHSQKEFSADEVEVLRALATAIKQVSEKVNQE